MPPPISLVLLAAFGALIMLVALFAPRHVRSMPLMRWLHGSGPRASRFTALLAGVAMLGVGLGRMVLLP